MWDDGADAPKYPTEADGRRVADALNDIIAELDRRGMEPVNTGSPATDQDKSGFAPKASEGGEHHG